MDMDNVMLGEASGFFNLKSNTTLTSSNDLAKATKPRGSAMSTKGSILGMQGGWYRYARGLFYNQTGLDHGGGHIRL